ncbi:MAG: universal stress protein [Acidobacteria bacterium]|jgi:nucleotide-binding universal stress UspA family protein|nr:universal stress protein [Acidobacteriota bacterium]
MTHVGKILVPVDLSPRSVGAARYAASLGSAFNSEIVFVHAIQKGWPLGDAESNARDAIMAVQGSTPSRFVVREGAPVPVILEGAETESVDLILMPTRGVPMLSRFFDRSITAQVLRAASCPVWAGVDDLSSLSSRPIRTVLCGLSLGPRAGSVLRCAADLARQLRATLTVIHASKSLESMPAYPCNGEWRLWVKAMARNDISALQKEAGTHADIWLEPGPPLAAIPTVAETLRADLLVIGKSPQRRILGDLRTMSYDMVCRAPCPVASV